MTNNNKPIERRGPPNMRAKRIAGGSTGTMVAVVVAWQYSDYTGKQMPPEVAAAIGGLLTTFLICLDDVIAVVWMAFSRRKG